MGLKDMAGAGIVTWLLGGGFLMFLIIWLLFEAC